MTSFKSCSEDTQSHTIWEMTNNIVMDTMMCFIIVTTHTVQISGSM